MFTKRNQKGFTLMEMLIVVAIIAILVAISIPVFTTQLEKARDATDLANARAAKGIAVSQYLTGDITITSPATSSTWFYDAANGILVNANSDITGYGKSAQDNDTAMTNPVDGDHQGQILQVVVANDGTVTLTWIDPA